MPTVERLSGWDYATWRSATEDPVMRSTMVGIMVLEKSPDWERLRSRYERASRQVLLLRKKVIEGPVGIANPRLVIDPHFDLSFHLRRFRLPEGATWQNVLDEAAQQSMTDFDRNRPLWKVTLLEGAPGGKSVLISKLHHAIADGQGALALGAALVDIDEKGFELGPMPDEPEAEDLSPRHFAEIMIHDNVEWLYSTANEIAHGAVPTIMQLLSTPEEAVGRIVDTVSSLIRFANSPYSPLSPIMTKRSVNYHFANFDMRFRHIKEAAKRDGHTI
ncbi:MAG: wax ester/triacylglycerol synthase domain-containing protein, partial [Actinomycetes bacterium]